MRVRNGKPAQIEDLSMKIHYDSGKANDGIIGEQAFLDLTDKVCFVS